ncbi:MAG: hypothetical protein WC322_05630 [Candidatus Paceibacterota bacterium]|jgi:hypothetical protein
MITAYAQHGATPKVVLELDAHDADNLAWDMRDMGWSVEDVAPIRAAIHALETLTKEVASGN